MNTVKCIAEKMAEKTVKNAAISGHFLVDLTNFMICSIISQGFEYLRSFFREKEAISGEDVCREV